MFLKNFKLSNISVWIPIFGYYLHDYIEFLAAVKQLSLDPTVYVTVLLDFFVVGEFKPPWILPNNSINETMKFYFDETIIASFSNDLFKCSSFLNLDLY